VHDWGFAHGGSRWDGGRGGYGGRDYARFGNYHNQPLSVHNGSEFNRSPLGRGFGSPQQPFAGRPQQGYGRMEGGPSRPQGPGQQAYNHTPPAYGRPEQFQGRMQPYGGQPFAGRPPMAGGPQPYGGRPQTFAGRPEPYARPQQFSQAPRPGGGYGGYPRPGQGYMGRTAPLETWRAPQQNSVPRSYGGGSSGWGQSFARPQAPSGHSFYGGGRSEPSFGGGHAFSGGSHSFGGGGRSFGGGGGHSFSGGGHSSGGGHRR
jgi:translation initiation factor IF-2